MKINILTVPFGFFTNENIQLEIDMAGYIISDKFDKEELWNICNWSCWSAVKPDNLFSNIIIANSDICFHNEETDDYELCTPLGWRHFNSLDAMGNYCLNYHIYKAIKDRTLGGK